MASESQDPTDHEMSLIGHLAELRSRIIICLAVIAVVGLVAFPLARPVLEGMTQPVRDIPLEPGHTDALTINVAPDGSFKIKDLSIFKDPEKIIHRHLIYHIEADPEHGRPAALDFLVGEGGMQRVIAPSPLDPVFLQVKIALILSIVMSLPVIFWQLWLFVKPGLTTRERSLAGPLLSGGLILFPIGAGFAYFVIKMMLHVMQQYMIPGVDPLINVHNYISLMLTLMLVFGFIFELPLIIAMAARIGLVTPAFLRQYRRHAYVVLAVVAMFFSPADPLSMLVMIIPLIGLYEISVACSIPMAKWHQRDVQLELAQESAT